MRSKKEREEEGTEKTESSKNKKIMLVIKIRKKSTPDQISTLPLIHLPTLSYMTSATPLNLSWPGY